MALAAAVVLSGGLRGCVTVRRLRREYLREKEARVRELLEGTCTTGGSFCRPEVRHAVVDRTDGADSAWQSCQKGREFGIINRHKMFGGRIGAAGDIGLELPESGNPFGLQAVVL